MNGMFEMDYINTGLKMLAMLLIVLALLVSVLYAMKRGLLFGRGANGNTIIKVLSSLHLTPKERIEVIEILGEKILLGITPSNISFLAKLSDSTGEKKEFDGKDSVLESGK